MTFRYGDVVVWDWRFRGCWNVVRRRVGQSGYFCVKLLKAVTEAGCSVTEFGVCRLRKEDAITTFYVDMGPQKTCDQRTGSVQNGKHDMRIMEHWI